MLCSLFDQCCADIPDQTCAGLIACWETCPSFSMTAVNLCDLSTTLPDSSHPCLLNIHAC